MHSRHNRAGPNLTHIQSSVSYTMDEATKLGKRKEAPVATEEELKRKRRISRLSSARLRNREKAKLDTLREKHLDLHKDNQALRKDNDILEAQLQRAQQLVELHEESERKKRLAAARSNTAATLAAATNSPPPPSLAAVSSAILAATRPAPALALTPEETLKLLLLNRQAGVRASAAVSQHSVAPAQATGLSPEDILKLRRVAFLRHSINAGAVDPASTTSMNLIHRARNSVFQETALGAASPSLTALVAQASLDCLPVAAAPAPSTTPFASQDLQTFIRFLQQPSASGLLS